MSGPLVAVLVPVYNGERHLAQCLESVRTQTHRHWQMVIVDNRSTDRSAEIAAAAAAVDSRIRLHVAADHVGVIENHNRAFAQLPPAAAYCKVVHADDWLFPRCLEAMVAVAEAHPSVGLVSAYRLEGDWLDLDGLPYPSTVVPGPALCRQSLLGGPYVFGSPTSVLFRADLVRRRTPFFDERSIHADEAVCYEVLGESDLGFVHEVLTYTRLHAASVSSSTARRLASRHAGNLWILTTYGPRHLRPVEYRRRLAVRLDEYDRVLARALLTGADAAFWTFHRRWRRELGVPVRPERLVWALAREAGRNLLPLGLARWLERRRSSTELGTPAVQTDRHGQTRTADRAGAAATRAAAPEEA